MPDLLRFVDITTADAPAVGGKGESLARAAVAALPVPPGFVVTTHAYTRLHAGGAAADPAFAAAVEAMLADIPGPVAVRSSATGEDGAEASFAGQQETVLGVVGIRAVLAAIDRCWRSLHTDRAVAYRREQGVADDGLAMAVVVQQLVNADAAGVLFTTDPTSPDAGAMLVEAAWGLGEVVVSGRVTPDRFRLNRETGDVIFREIGVKTVQVTAAGEEEVPQELQRQLCLTDDELRRLADLGRRVEAFFGGPRDIEWAVAGGEIFLLQARPITSAGDDIRAEIVAELRREADSAGTVWVRYNLSEVLPEPTPMTWAVVQRLLAADGGFGAMTRDLGGRPDPELGSRGAFDLVAGRPMANLSRMPRMQFPRPPFEYPFAATKADPRAALNPVAVANPLKGGWKSLFGLPGVMAQMSRMKSLTTSRALTFADDFRTNIAPPFAAAARAAIARDWSKLDPPALVNELDVWVNRTLVTFAADSLKPTVFADAAWQELAAAVGKDTVAAFARGAAPDPAADLAGAVRAAAAGTLSRAEFLANFGHRGPKEMDLSSPRWAERPDLVDALFAAAPHPAAAQEPVTIPPKLEPVVTRLRTYLGLREAGKHHLLMGYNVIRRTLLEIDARFALNGGVFFLTPADFTDLLSGADVQPRIAARRRRRQRELALPVPPVLFSDDLDAVGRPEKLPEGATTFAATAISSGVAEGLALVLTDPAAAPAGDGFILVCPSTDPAWVPLFARAKGLVMETGGVLSHGAIVAREFGLPAVAGLPAATRLLKTGQRLRVDGTAGTVSVV